MTNESKRGIKRKSLNEAEAESILQLETTTVSLLGEEQQLSSQQQPQPRRVSNPFRQLNHDNDTRTTKTISSVHSNKQIKISSILPVLNSGGTSNTATINVLSNDNDDNNDNDNDNDNETTLLDEEASYLRGLLRPCSAFSYDDEEEEEEEEGYNSCVEDDSKWTFLQKGIIAQQDQIVGYNQYYDYSNIVDDDEEEDIYVTDTTTSSGRYYNDYEQEEKEIMVTWDDIVNETLNDMETLHLRIKYYNNKKYSHHGQR